MYHLVTVLLIVGVIASGDTGDTAEYEISILTGSVSGDETSSPITVTIQKLLQSQVNNQINIKKCFMVTELVFSNAKFRFCQQHNDLKIPSLNFCNFSHHHYFNVVYYLSRSSQSANMDPRRWVQVCLGFRQLGAPLAELPCG